MPERLLLGTSASFSSVVINDLVTRYGKAIGAYIYCDYRDQMSQIVVGMLGCVLRQLLISSSCIPETIITVLESILKSAQGAEIGDISEMLKVILPQLGRSFLCVDALDGLESRTRFTLLKALRTEFGTVRIFLTGRPHIEPEVNEALQIQLDAMHIAAKEVDIRGCLIHKIGKDMNLNRDDMNEQLR